jgi:hypothetical protein
MAQTNPWELPVAGGAPATGAPAGGTVGVVIPKAPEKPEKPEETFRFATEAEKIAEGLDPNRAYQISATSGKFIDVAGQPTAKPVIEQDTNRIPQISTGLSAVKDLQSLSNRFLSVGRQAGNIAETPLLGSLLGQNRADLEGSLEILKGIIIQDQLARLAKINPAGISSLANTPSEQERFVSSIANLDPNQSPEQFAIGLKRAEDYLNRQLKEAGGEMPAPQAGDKASQLQEAFNRGATLEELNAIAKTLGITPNQADLVEAIRFRDAKGVGARILPPEAGGAPEETGFFEGIIETVTGSERSTPEIEALPEWTTMPELNELSVAGARTGIGTMFTSPEESVKIIQANYPGVQVRQDSKGNYILRSQDGREYGIRPGFRWSDVPRAIGGILAFTPAGRATTVAGAAGGSALTQAGIEATQAGAGGTFDTGDIALAGAGGAGGQLLAEAIPAVVSGVRNLRRGTAGALPEAIPVPSAPEVPTMAPVSTASEEAAIGQRLYDIQTRLREGMGSPELEQEALALSRQLRDLQTPEYMRPGYVAPRREPLPMSEPTPASTTSEEAILSQRLRDIQDQLQTGAGSPQLEQESLAVSRRLRWLQTPDYMKVGAVEPPPIPQATAAPMAGVAEEVVTGAAAPSRFIPTEELDNLISTATKRGAEGKAAQQKIIELAEINPEAKAAAESLGFELPIDVYADNPQIRAALGLERSQFGTPAQGEWDVTLRNAIDNADNISQQFDALFIGGVPATGAVSQKIKTGLEQSKNALKSQASALYKKVDEGVSANVPVNLDNLFTTLQDVVAEVGEGGLNQQEKKLLDLFQTGEAGAGDITYGRLIREKNLIRRAKEGKESPYGSLDEASLTRLEGALAKDQLDNVERIAGEETRRNLRAANLLYAKQSALGKRMVSAFGRDLEGDLNSLLLGAISESKTGGARKFNKLMKTVPEEYRKEALATAIASATRSKASQGFGFAEFRDFYPALRANPEVFGQIAKEMGPDWVKAMNSLLTVSKRMTEARSVSGLGTGATLQANLRKSLAAQGKLQNFLNSTMVQRVVAGTTSFVPGLSFLVPDMIEWMGTLGKNKLDAAQQLFKDPEFLNALEQSATQGAPSTATVNKLSMSKPFRSYAKAFGISDNPKDWLKTTLSATAPQMNEQTQPSAPEGVPMVRTQ